MIQQVTKGVVDIYVCSCGAPHCVVSMNIGIVIDTTPCNKCKKSFAKSIGGRINAFLHKTRIQNLSIVFCWYRPTLEEYITMNAEQKLFVFGGGLLWGKFGEPKFIHDPTADQFSSTYTFSNWVKDNFTISKG